MPTLGTVGIADKGNYSAVATYKKGNFVYYEGSTWLALKDNLRGVMPQEGANWKYLARGFQAELLSMVLATDTSGLIGTAGEQVGAQALMDKVSDMIATKMMMKSDLVNQIVNDATKAASAAALYSVNEELKRTNSNFGGLKFWSADSLKVLGLSLQAATTNDIYAALPNSSLVFCNYEPNSALMTEMGNNNGGALLLFKETSWRGFGYATCIQSGVDFGRIGHITAANKLEWIKIGK